MKEIFQLNFFPRTARSVLQQRAILLRNFPDRSRRSSSPTLPRRGNYSAFGIDSGVPTPVHVEYCFATIMFYHWDRKPAATFLMESKRIPPQLLLPLIPDCTRRGCTSLHCAVRTNKLHKAPLQISYVNNDPITEYSSLTGCYSRYERYLINFEPLPVYTCILYIFPSIYMLYTFLSILYIYIYSLRHFFSIIFIFQFFFHKKNPSRALYFNSFSCSVSSPPLPARWTTQLIHRRVPGSSRTRRVYWMKINDARERNE